MNDNQNNQSIFPQKPPFFARTPVLTATAFFCCLLWGSATPAIKNGYRLLEINGVPSILLFAGLRFFLAGLFTVIIFSLMQRKCLVPKKENVGRVLITSLFQTVLQYIFFYVGLSKTTGVKGTVASGSGAFFAMLLATLLFRQEKCTLRKVVACVLGFSGIVLMNINGLADGAGQGDLFGVILVLLSTVAASFGSVFIRRYSAYENPVTLSGYQFMVGGLCMVLLGLLTGGSLNMQSIVGVLDLLYLALLSAVAYSLWCILLRYNPVSRVSAFTFLIPISGVLLTKLFLSNEASHVHPVQLLFTLLLISLGIFLLNYNGKTILPQKKADTAENHTKE